MENSIYTVEYFIKKFQAIPENEIGVGNPASSHCALYHVGIVKDYISNPNEEAKALMMLFGWDGMTCVFQAHAYELVYEVNDGFGENKKYGKTPKQRILAALYDIYEKTYGRKYGEQQQPKEKVVYKTVVIDSAVKTLQETLTEN